MYKVVDRKRFRYAVRTVRNAVLVLIAVIWFCVFIYQHSGLNYKVEEDAVREFVTYEYLTETSAENPRQKETKPVKVVYRWFE